MDLYRYERRLGLPYVRNIFVPRLLVSGKVSSFLMLRAF